MNAYRRYAQTQVETASPEKTLSMLLEGALTRIRNGIALLEKGRRFEAVAPLTKAGDIVIELERTLRPDVAPELCQQLAELYRFVALRLTQSAAKGDLKLAREAEKVLSPVVEGFRELLVPKGASPGR
jgi:flagellar protein FliS